MFAIAFDLVVADTAQHHPKGVSQAYADIGSTLANFGFDRCKEVSTRHLPKTSPICSVRSWRSRRYRGYPHPCVIFVPSVSSNGRILPDW